ncbi:succinate--hydroxymethylglutarate CoA-transferase isoform X6, variant 2 [Balamuthia mandrillaris]
MCPFSSSPWRRTYSSKSSLSLLSRRSSGINRSFFPLSSFVQRAVTLPLYPTITTPLGDRRRSFATQQEAKEKEDEEDAAAKGPLAGVKVLDLGRILAAPYCSMVLGDLGAEIWKVEVPGTGDDTRTWGPPFTAKGHESAYFISCNRNKKSIAVDLKKPQGLKIVHELAKHADVLIENFAPGKADSLGVGYSALSTLNPRLIYLSLTGFGPDGPYKDRLAYDVMVSGFGGLMSITGPEEGAPVKTGVALTDICAGLYAHGAIIAALYAREKSGKGQKIDVSLLESQVATLANVASSYLIGGMEPKRMGTAHSSIVPYQAFATANRGHILIGALNDGQFQRLCEKR